MPLTDKQEDCSTSSVDHSDLTALFLNCTLKRSPAVSNTQGLADISIGIMRRRASPWRSYGHRPRHRHRRLPDMTEHGWATDDWPAIHERVLAADILVLCTPIWLGEKSSVCTR